MPMRSKKEPLIWSGRNHRFYSPFGSSYHSITLEFVNGSRIGGMKRSSELAGLGRSALSTKFAVKIPFAMYHTSCFYVWYPWKQVKCTVMAYSNRRGQAVFYLFIPSHCRSASEHTCALPTALPMQRNIVSMRFRETSTTPGKKSTREDRWTQSPRTFGKRKTASSVSWCYPLECAVHSAAMYVASNSHLSLRFTLLVDCGGCRRPSGLSFSETYTFTKMIGLKPELNPAVVQFIFQSIFWSK